ncbi:EF-hand domain-containing protein [Lysobacter sp. TAF61]|uniref:EF-hand domain-containing protein n=1 Tax=Lysobacter sp. TAF61 TaxID=3233072 RepID=UPI003F9CF51C
MPTVSRNVRPALQCAGFSFALLVALAMPSWAQVQAAGDYLSRMDSDGDGRIALPEFQDWMSYAFNRMDVDGDGVLTPAELPGGRGKPVTLAEHRQTLATTFARQDRNKDGYLDARELASPPQ